MKEVFLNRAIEFIARNTNNQDCLGEEKREMLTYGLEGLYMTITKLVVIFLVAFLLGFIREFIITLIFFNIISQFCIILLFCVNICKNIFICKNIIFYKFSICFTRFSYES